MLEGLNKIDWGALEGPYGSSSKVPDMLRAAINAPDRDTFYAAYSEFINEVNHQGTIYQVTAYTVPFLLELLQSSDNIIRSEAYLYALLEYVRGARVYPHMGQTDYSEPPTHYRYRLALHDAVCSGLEIYAQHLAHSELHIRGLAMFIMTFLADFQQQVTPLLLNYIEQETDQWMRGGAVWGLARLWQDVPHIWKYQEWLGYFKNWAEEESNRWVKTAAALAFAQLQGHDLPSTIVTILAESLSQPVDHWIGNPNWYYFFEPDFLPFEEKLISQIGRIASIANNKGLIQIISQCEATPIVMHRLIRELMEASFFKIHATPWEWRFTDPTHNYEPNNPLVYSTPVTFPHYVPGRLVQYQRDALAAVVTCDPFWEIPTNLFSFFYGLPDDREALRRALSK